LSTRILLALTPTWSVNFPPIWDQRRPLGHSWSKWWGTIKALKPNHRLISKQVSSEKTIIDKYFGKRKTAKTGSSRNPNVVICANPSKMNESWEVVETGFRSTATSDTKALRYFWQKANSYFWSTPSV
jgi:hypothetical protein